MPFAKLFAGMGMGSAVGAGGAVLAGTTSIGLTSTAAIAGSVAGSVASQAFGVAARLQDGISWKGVALAGISAGVSGGLAGGFETIAGSAFLGDVVRGALGSVVSQGIGVATRLQDKFDFAGVAAAGLGSGASGAIGLGGFEGRLVGNTVGGIANAAARSLLGGTDFGDNILAALPDVIGQTIGGMVAGAASRMSPGERALVAEAAEAARGAVGSGGSGGWTLRGGKLRLAGSNFADQFMLGYAGQAQNAPQAAPAEPAPSVKPRLSLVPPAPPVEPAPPLSPAMASRLAGVVAGVGEFLISALEAVVILPPIIINAVLFIPPSGRKISYRFGDFSDVSFERQSDDGPNFNIMRDAQADAPRRKVGEAEWANGVVTIREPATVAQALGLERLPWTQNIVRKYSDGNVTGSGYSSTDPDELRIISNGAKAGLSDTSITAMVQNHRVQQSGGSTSVAADSAGPIAGGGAKIGNLSPGEITRIQNAANKSGATISVVGSKAAGGGKYSDYDYILEGGTSRSRSRIKNSLPKGPPGTGDGSGRDFLPGRPDPLRPHITFKPK